MVFTSSNSEGFLGNIENVYFRKNLTNFRAGTAIPLLRDHIWIVVRGMVKLSCLNEQGENVLLAINGPNETFGEPLTYFDLYEAKSLSDCDLHCLSMKEVQLTPHLTLQLMQAMINRTRQAEALMMILSLRGIENRVQGFLELLAQDYGQLCNEGLKLNFRLTHQEIASAVSSTRVSITKALAQLKEEGWLQFDVQQKIIVNHLSR